MNHQVVFYAKAHVYDTSYQLALIHLYYQDKQYEITMHKHHLAKNDLFEVGRWFDFRIVRVDGEVDLELSRRPDLEDNIWSRRAKLTDTSYLD